MNLEAFHAETENANAHWLEYISSYDKEEKKIYLFCEGEDDMYFYETFLRPTLRVLEKDYEIESVHCGGKKKVLEVYDSINWNSTYSKHRTWFMVDKDYEDLVGHPSSKKDENIFVTQYYAIENYLVDWDVFQEILRRFHSINDRDLLSSIKEDFIETEKIVIQKLLPFTGWIMEHRKHNTEMKLENIGLNDFITFYSEKEIKQHSILGKIPTIKCTSNKFKKNFIGVIRSTPTNLKPSIKRDKLKSLIETKSGCNNTLNLWQIIRSNMRLCSGESKSYIRGKYHLMFLLDFYRCFSRYYRSEMNSIISNYNKTNSGKKFKKIEERFKIDKDNIISTITPILHVLKGTPQDIDTFFKLHLSHL